VSAFDGKIVVITGAASGLGRALARALAAEGATLAAVDRDAIGLTSLADELKPSPFASAVADVTDRGGLTAAVAGLEDRLGRIDLLIANAGIGLKTEAFPFPAYAIEQLVRVNLLGVVNSVAAVLPGMMRRGQGHLVGISSLASFRGLPGMAGYCASKAGVNALLDALRVELRPRGIQVTTICPGWIRTPMTAGLNVPMPHILEAADAARRIVHAIRRGRAFVAFPARPARQLRFLRWLPVRLSDWLLYRLVRSLDPE
jgi:NAD(P)-dependent dehydrogenase (short-subunit alcohol dehydrogenase family)